MMKINDIAYIIYQDHICKCTVKGMEEDRGDLYYHLYNHYTRKKVPWMVIDWCVFETLEKMTKKHMDEHCE